MCFNSIYAALKRLLVLQNVRCLFVQKKVFDECNVLFADDELYICLCVFFCFIFTGIVAIVVVVFGSGGALVHILFVCFLRSEI